VGTSKLILDHMALGVTKVSLRSPQGKTKLCSRAFTQVEKEMLTNLQQNRADLVKTQSAGGFGGRRSGGGGGGTPGQPTIQAAYASVTDEAADEAILQCHLGNAWSAHSVSNQLFRNMIQTVREAPAGYVPPTRAVMRQVKHEPGKKPGVLGLALKGMNTVLKKEMVTVVVNGGFTCQIDKGKDKQKRGMMNSVFSCPRLQKMYFGKHTDFSLVKKVDAKAVFQELKQTIDRMEKLAGYPLTTMLVTDGGSAETKARKMAEKHYTDESRILFSARCCAHAWDLVLKKCGLTAFHACLMKPAFRIMHFVLQHQATMAAWCELAGVKQLQQPAVTRFASYWLTMVSFLADEAHLIALFKCEAVSEWLQDTGADFLDLFDELAKNYALVCELGPKTFIPD